MEQLSNNKQNGIAILSMLVFIVFAQGILLADKILGHSLLSWWWVWSPSLFLLGTVACIVLYFCIRIIIFSLNEFYNERLQRRN